MSIKFLLPVSIAVLYSLIGCGGNVGSDISPSSGSVTKSLNNGYQLTGIESRNSSGEVETSATITYDEIDNTGEISGYDSIGSLVYRDVYSFNDEGRLTGVVGYHGDGELRDRYSYTIEEGLITQKTSLPYSREHLEISYTSNNRVLTREYSNKETGVVERVVEFTHDGNGEILKSELISYTNSPFNPALPETILLATYEYVFNDMGQSVLRTVIEDNESRTEEYLYDGHGNNTQRTFRDSDGNVTRESIYTFAPSISPAINLRLRTIRFFL